MRVKPILFNTEMVRALLDGRKTVTRLVVKPQPQPYMFGDKEELAWVAPHIIPGYYAVAERYTEYLIQPYQPGDILYVQEKWTRFESCQYCACDNEPEDQNGCYVYYATHGDGFDIKWHSPKSMPRKAARIFLRVTDVRVERLQEIDADGIRAEGLTSLCAYVGDMEIAAQEFALLWDSTIKPADRDSYGWAANPWVWVIRFERCEKQERTGA